MLTNKLKIHFVIGLIIFVITLREGLRATSNNWPNLVHVKTKTRELEWISHKIFGNWISLSNPVSLEDINNFHPNHCLVAISNFVGSDLTRVNQPILLRRPVPASFLDLGKPSHYSYTGWIMGDNPNKTANSCYQVNPSKNVQEGYNEFNAAKVARCSQFDLQKLALHAKLWNCELRLDLFAPIFHPHASREFSYPELWFDKSGPNSSVSHLLPSIIPVIHAFLIPLEQWSAQHLTSKWGKHLFIYSVGWMNCIRAMSPYTRNLIPVLVDISLDKMGHFAITSAQLIHHRVYSEHLFVLFEDTKATTFSFAAILSLQIPYWTLPMIWEGVYDIQTSIGEEAWPMKPTKDLNLFQTCSSNFSLSPNKILNIRLQEKGDEYIVSRVVEHLWKSIWKNFFYKLEFQTYCENIDQFRYHAKFAMVSRLVIQKVALRPRLYLPVHFANSLGSYRFVICGFRGKESMAYTELLKVYDVFSWVFLAATMVTVAIIISKITTVWYLLATKRCKNADSSKNLYVTLKVMLEQGSPIPDEILKENCSHKRILLGIFMLMGIVFSNGYKNSNVYNMVSPRKLVRYEKLWQLVEDNVRIYAASLLAKRSRYTSDISLYHLLKDPPSSRFFNNVSGRVMSRHRVNYVESGHSGMFRFSAVTSMPQINITKNTWYYETNENIYAHETLTKASHILPVSWELIRNWWNMTRNLDALINIGFDELVNNLLTESLMRCNKTTIIVKSYLAHSYALEMTSARGNKGKDVYFPHYFSFGIEGYVTPVLLKRLWGMRDSGIMEWWSNITEYSAMIQKRATARKVLPQKENGPSAVSLQGNIIVVFSVLIAGFLTTLIIFFLETIRDSRKCRMVWVLFWNAVNNLQHMMMIRFRVMPICFNQFQHVLWRIVIRGWAWEVLTLQNLILPRGNFRDKYVI